MTAITISAENNIIDISRAWGFSTPYGASSTTSIASLTPRLAIDTGTLPKIYNNAHSQTNVPTGAFTFAARAERIYMMTPPIRVSVIVIAVIFR